MGAGTGILTAQLVDAGCVPIAIEPVASMRNSITAAHPQVTVIDGTAENTGLDDNSVDTVVAAQAFHWFDPDAAPAEIERILRPGGFLVCVWNVRDETVDWVRRYTDVVDRYAGDTPRHRTMKWRQAIDRSAAFVPVDDWTVANPKPTTPRQVVDRALSTSFIAALEPAVQSEVLDQDSRHRSRGRQLLRLPLPLRDPSLEACFLALTAGPFTATSPSQQPKPLENGIWALGYLREHGRRLGLLQVSGPLSSTSSRILRAKTLGLAWTRLKGSRIPMSQRRQADTSRCRMC